METKDTEQIAEEQIAEETEQPPEQTPQDTARQTEPDTAEESAPEKKKKESRKQAKDKHAEALKALEAKLAAQQDAHLRLMAEYDNYRKRSQKEKDNIYTEAKSDTAARFLPVFDNLERALNQPCTDEAYKKGIEMTMNGLREVMTALGVEEFGEVGDTFDPNCHNAVMHTENPELGENVISQVFAKGFRIGEKIVRFAMVQVAN